MSSSDSSDSSLTSSLAAGAAAVSAAAAGAATAANADGSARKALTCQDKVNSLIHQIYKTSLYLMTRHCITVWLFYLFCQGEGVVCLHSNSQDSLVAIDDRVGDRCQSGVANLQAHTSNVPHTLRQNISGLTATYHITLCTKQIKWITFSKSKTLSVELLISPPGTWYAA